MPGRKRVLNIAHRGGAGLFPENTIYAFSRAVSIFGVDVIEMDVWMSRDGCPIVIHDASVNRITNGNGRVSKMTLSEIKSLDAAYYFNPEGERNYPLRGMGITIPSLQEVFESLPGVMMNIEIQQVYPPMENWLYNLILEYDMQELVTVAAKNHLVHKRFRSLNKAGVSVSASINQSVLFSIFSELGLSRLYHPDINVFQLPDKIGNTQLITPKLIEAAHVQGKEVHVWIINDPEEMEKFIEMGIDGIITDFPDRLREIIMI